MPPFAESPEYRDLSEWLVGRILDAVVTAVDVPVTLKIRTGWDAENRNGLRIALLGYLEFKPRSFEADAHRPGVAWSGEDDQVIEDIIAARTIHHADIVIPSDVPIDMVMTQVVQVLGEDPRRTYILGTTTGTGLTSSRSLRELGVEDGVILQLTAADQAPHPASASNGKSRTSCSCPATPSP